MMRTLRPAFAAVMPKLTVSEVLPTPPFPLANGDYPQRALWHFGFGHAFPQRLGLV